MRKWQSSSSAIANEGSNTLRGACGLEEIYEYLEKRQPIAARRVMLIVERQIGWLADFPYMAPATEEPGCMS
jgi:hypothetical protein